MPVAISRMGLIEQHTESPVCDPQTTQRAKVLNPIEMEVWINHLAHYGSTSWIMVRHTGGPNTRFEVLI